MYRSYFDQMARRAAHNEYRLVVGGSCGGWCSEGSCRPQIYSGVSSPGRTGSSGRGLDKGSLKKLAFSGNHVLNVVTELASQDLTHANRSIDQNWRDYIQHRNMDDYMEQKRLLFRTPFAMMDPGGSLIAI